MKNALFVDSLYLQENSPLSKNLDLAAVFPFVRTAQEVYILEAIGSSLYNYLQDVLTASPQVISPEDEEVLNLIRSALVWYSLLDSLPFIWIQLRNAGLLKQGADNTETVSADELNVLKNECKTKGVWYINRLISFLCANGSKYDAYNEGCYSCGDVAPNGKPRNSVDLYFDERTLLNDTRAEFILRNSGWIK